MSTALITGSYGGLGSCFAEIHAKCGGDLILVGRNIEKLKKQASELKDRFNINVTTIESDLSKPDSAEQIFSYCERQNLSVDYLINNAGLGGQGRFAAERTVLQDMDIINVNIVTPTLLLKLFLPKFIERGYGRVLNVSSSAAAIPGPLQSVYFASKAYLTSLSEALWREERETGVTVTVLIPGAMKTGFEKSAGLDGTMVFMQAVDPMDVAKSGYEGMLKGKLKVTSGLPGIQRPFMALTPIMPRKAMLNFVYMLQKKSK